MKRKKKLNKEASSIGIIGGWDGPTAVYIGTKKGNHNQEKKWDQLIEACKEIIVPRTNKITGEELKKHLQDEYDAKEARLTDGGKRALKFNVIMNYYQDDLEQFKAMQNSDVFVDNFHNIDLMPDDKYKLQFAAFTIPRTSKTERFYLELEQEIRNHRYKRASIVSRMFNRHSKGRYLDIEDMKVEIELSTGYMTIKNGARELMNEIALWKGMTDEDINNSTPIFMSYVAAMRDTGEMVYSEDEGKWKKG